MGKKKKIRKNKKTWQNLGNDFNQLNSSLESANPTVDKKSLLSRLNYNYESNDNNEVFQQRTHHSSIGFTSVLSKKNQTQMTDSNNEYKEQNQNILPNNSQSGELDNAEENECLNNSLGIDNNTQSNASSSSAQSTENVRDTYFDNEVAELRKLIESIPEEEGLIEAIEEFNAMTEELKHLDEDFVKLKNQIIKSNVKFPSFKKQFCEAIEEPGWGEKLFYFIPVLDDGVWQNTVRDNRYCDEIVSILSDKENRDSQRQLLNRKLQNVFTLLKGLYYYRTKEDITVDVDEQAIEKSRKFAPRVIQLLKHVFNLSDALRDPLVTVIDKDENHDYSPELFLPNNKQQILQEIDGLKETNYDKLYEIKKLLENRNFLDKYSCNNIQEGLEKFKQDSQSLYTLVQQRKGVVESLKKSLYTVSFKAFYDLFEDIRHSLNEFLNLPDYQDRASSEFKKMFIEMLQNLRSIVLNYLFVDFHIKPLPIEIGMSIDKFEADCCSISDTLNGNPQDPHQQADMIAEILQTGFAEFEDDKSIFICRPAKVIVYT